MNNKLWGSASTALCLLALSMPSHADTRTEWGPAFKGSAPLDDSALMEVSARGSIDENAVKVLQNNGKLSEYATSAGAAQIILGTAAAESAEKQAAQTQYKMAMGAAQTMTNTVQLTGVIASIAAPVFVPVMTMPMFGLPFLPPKASNDR